MHSITPSVPGSDSDAARTENTLYIILTPVGSLVHESGSGAAGELPMMPSHVCVGGLPGNDMLSRCRRCQASARLQTSKETETERQRHRLISSQLIIMLINNI